MRLSAGCEMIAPRCCRISSHTPVFSISGCVCKFVMVCRIRHTEGVTFCIYGIFDPRDDLIFYVGHTSCFALRRAQHLDGADSLSGLPGKQIKANGLAPVVIKLETCRDKEAALMAEIFWIEHFKGRGARLMNAQGFSGYAAREGERRRLRQDVGQVTRAKSGPIVWKPSQTGDPRGKAVPGQGGTMRFWRSWIARAGALRKLPMP